MLPAEPVTFGSSSGFREFASLSTRWSGHRIPFSERVAKSRIQQGQFSLNSNASLETRSKPQFVIYRDSLALI